MSRVSQRILAWVLALLVLSLPLVGLLQGWYGASSWPIRSVEIQADYEQLDSDDVRDGIVPLIDKGFFATRLDKVQHAIENLPWVEAASVRKRWPDALRVHITERRAFAHWNDDELLDANAVRFKAPVDKLSQSLPYLAGPNSSTERVLAFYGDVTERLAAVDLMTIGVTLSARNSWIVTLRDGAQLRLGGNDWESNLQRFIRVYPKLKQTHEQGMAYADLRYTNGFAVRWKEDENDDDGAPAT